MITNGFTTRLNGEPIPPRQPPYVGNFAVPCKNDKRLAKAIAPMVNQTFKAVASESIA